MVENGYLVRKDAFLDLFGAKCSEPGGLIFSFSFLRHQVCGYILNNYNFSNVIQLPNKVQSRIEYRNKIAISVVSIMGKLPQLVWDLFNYKNLLSFHPVRFVSVV